MPLEPWIDDYVTAYFGKQHCEEPHWDKDKQRCVQIIGRVKQSKPKSSKKSKKSNNTAITLIISDSTVQIECKVIPKLIEMHGCSSFESNNIINLQTFDLRISCSFDSIYFVLMECSFLTALNVAHIGQHKQRVPLLNNNNNIQRLITKHRICEFFKFNSKDGLPEFDENNLPYSLHSAQQMDSFGFDNEINSLKQTFTTHEENELEQIDVDNDALHELCLEYDDPYIQSINYNISNEEDVDMEEDNAQNIEINIDASQNQNQNKKTSDKEEMEEDENENEEKEITLTLESECLGNQCDWLYCLYPNFKDMPRRLKVKIKEVIKPLHTPSVVRNYKKRKVSPVISASAAKRQKIMPGMAGMNVDEKGDDMDGSQKYSQTSLNSNDILQCDEMVKKREREKKSSSESEFVKPTYSLTAKLRNNKNNNKNNNNANKNNNDDGDGNDSIILIEDSDDDGNIDEMEDLFEENDVDEDDDDGRDIMNEEVDPNYLGSITRNDLMHIARYFIKKGNELNANNNDNINNPFFVDRDGSQ